MRSDNEPFYILAATIIGAIAGFIFASTAVKKNSQEKRKAKLRQPKTLNEKSIEELEQDLQNFIANDQFEQAAQLRDIINEKKLIESKPQ